MRRLYYCAAAVIDKAYTARPLHHHTRMNGLNDRSRGLIAATSAFLIWGLLPLYMRALDSVPPVEIMVHRLLWCCLFTLAILLLKGQLRRVPAILRQPHTAGLLLLSALLISANWLVYVWAVSARHVVEASLGYFVNPLVSVLLGVFVLRERLNGIQWTAVAIAGAGVVWLTLNVGRPPWIALVLAFSFAFYGLVRKRVEVDAITGLTVETLLLAPLAIAFLVWRGGDGAFGAQGGWIDALLLASGVFTAVPLMLFAFGVRRVPLATIGLIQYLGPTLQLLIGVWLFGEAFTHVQALGFGLIWGALALYAIDGLWRRRRTAAVAAPEAEGV
jgi:chloramphenicol-sensitive protein RarD